MATIVNRIENYTIAHYGFESARTLRTFRATEVLRKMFKIEY